MEDYDELWDEYASEFNEKLESDLGGDWSKLDETEQEIAALWKLAADMYSGGFDEFFLNWGFDCYSYAMRGIKRIADAAGGSDKSGLNNVYKLFDKAYNKVFARFENDDRIKSYADIARYLTDKDMKVLEKTYESFDEKLGPLLCQKAYEYYCKSLGKTV